MQAGRRGGVDREVEIGPARLDGLAEVIGDVADFAHDAVMVEIAPRVSPSQFPNRGPDRNPDPGGPILTRVG